MAKLPRVSRYSGTLGGHGTHVAGTIAQQTNNTVGYAGVAYGVTLMPIKACWEFVGFVDGPWGRQDAFPRQSSQVATWLAPSQAFGTQLIMVPKSSI